MVVYQRKRRGEGKRKVYDTGGVCSIVETIHQPAVPNHFSLRRIKLIILRVPVSFLLEKRTLETFCKISE